VLVREGENYYFEIEMRGEKKKKIIKIMHKDRKANANENDHKNIAMISAKIGDFFCAEDVFFEVFVRENVQREICCVLR
jgi:hypothetical protein